MRTEVLFLSWCLCFSICGWRPTWQDSANKMLPVQLVLWQRVLRLLW